MPGKPSEKALAAVIEADKPTRVPGEGRSAPPRPEPGSVAVRTVEAGEDGAFFASGMGPAGATVRLYMNDSLVADVTTAADGSWGLRVERGMSPGHYEVRADLVEEGGNSMIVQSGNRAIAYAPVRSMAMEDAITPPPVAPEPQLYSSEVSVVYEIGGALGAAGK